MSNIDLILKEIEDKYTREDFFRIKNFIDQEVMLSGNFKFHEALFETAVNGDVNFAHNLDFVPTDVIVLSVIGDQNVYFKMDEATRDNLVLSVRGPAKIRFLAGSYSDRLSPTNVDLPFVSFQVNELDGGFANSVYLATQTADGGDANGC